MKRIQLNLSNTYSFKLFFKPEANDVYICKIRNQLNENDIARKVYFV